MLRVGTKSKEDDLPHQRWSKKELIFCCSSVANTEEDRPNASFGAKGVSFLMLVGATSEEDGLMFNSASQLLGSGHHAALFA
mmetsp:Transcript_20091/g.58121  ORF Transcript_20091/g.58121 Transcript_20091/m.58121 type:complete len:82 (-) Transcript_20091:706-951(-)